jgi:hypothetical protein
MGEIPFSFVLDELVSLPTRTRPMFGCTAVYVGEKIVFVLREKAGQTDNGVWGATSREHHESLRRELPILRPISIFGAGDTNWQNLPSDHPRFESNVVRACELVALGDERIGKVPKPRKPSARKRASISPARKRRRGRT